MVAVLACVKAFGIRPCGQDDAGQPVQCWPDHSGGDGDQPDHAEEDPVPAEQFGDHPGGERADEGGDNPRSGKSGEDLRMQPGRVDARDHHVECDVDGTRTKTLHQAAGDQHRHYRRGSGHQKSDDEEHGGGLEGHDRTGPIAPVASDDHADHPGGERPGERQGIEAGAIRVRTDDRHHSGHGERFERTEEDECAGTKSDPQVLRAEQARFTVDCGYWGHRSEPRTT